VHSRALLLPASRAFSSIVPLGALVPWRGLIIDAGVFFNSARQLIRPRHEVPAWMLVVLWPLFRYSAWRDAWILRVVGERFGPVLVRLPYISWRMRASNVLARTGGSTRERLADAVPRTRSTIAGPLTVYANTGDSGPDPVLEELAAVEDWIAAGAPALAQLWAERQEVEPPARPLTVAQAAQAANVSEQTIRRRLSQLAALEPAGAWRVGRVWRIRPEALDDLKTVRAGEKAVQRRRRSQTAKAPTSTRWQA
jgi:hypothetical protein